MCSAFAVPHIPHTGGLARLIPDTAKTARSEYRRFSLQDEKKSRPENRPCHRIQSLRIALLSPMPDRIVDPTEKTRHVPAEYPRPAIRRKPNAQTIKTQGRSARSGFFARLNPAHRKGTHHSDGAAGTARHRPPHSETAVRPFRQDLRRYDGMGTTAPPKEKRERPSGHSRFGKSYIRNYNFGPAATSALPASLPVNLAKFLMKRSARSLALASHCAASA